MDGKYDRLSETYWSILRRARSDPEYDQLLIVSSELGIRYGAILAELPPEARETIELYVASRENLNRRMLECACEEIVFSEPTA